MNNRFGFHVRLHDSLFDAFDESKQLELQNFQSVIISSMNKIFTFSPEEKEKFLEIRRKKFNNIFIHSAYWSVITRGESWGFKFLKKEIALAEELEFTGIVIHSGAFKEDLSQEERIERITKAVEILLESSSKITILLENSPHKGRVFAGDIQEFGLVFDRLNCHDRVKLCLDTAHAFAFGYDITTDEKIDYFIKFVCKTVGQKNIGLLHCNDTEKKCGSYLDKHAVPGEGKIGFDALYKFVHHPLIADVPVIMELPAITEDKQREIVQKFMD